jgi:CRISPR/Cas system-associated exonuclease Cas4 (RecB family)
MEYSLSTPAPKPPRTLSKSKILSYRQCPKRLWLEVHRPGLQQVSDGTRASFTVGNRVGDVARQLFNPQGTAQLIDVKVEGAAVALARTQELLMTSQPIFEAGFSAAGAIAFADVLLPVRRKGKDAWRMVEVKSSTSVKDYHREDAAIQAYVARAAGVPLESISLAHVNKKWVYAGDDDYQGLLKEEDVTAEASRREPEVKEWIAAAQDVAAQESEPAKATGGHCAKPFDCGFLDYCRGQEPQAEYPVRWLPNIRTKALKAHIATQGVIDLRHVPDELLNEPQRRVKAHTLSGEVYFDSKKAAAALAKHKLPAYFLDFETIQFAVPIWKGTRPYQSLPFQFSVHRLSRGGELEHEVFLDLSGNDPTRALAEALIAACGERGSIFVYSSFEAARILELGKRFPKWKPALNALLKRLVDLLPIAEEHYYHPSQQGSWSIKNVLPAVAPELRYDALEGVKDGGMAMAAYMEAIAPDTRSARKQQIESELRDYCALDTKAMIKLWEFFSSRTASRFPMTDPSCRTSQSSHH